MEVGAQECQERCRRTNHVNPRQYLTQISIQGIGVDAVFLDHTAAGIILNGEFDGGVEIEIPVRIGVGKDLTGLEILQHAVYILLGDPFHLAGTDGVEIHLLHGALYIREG